MNVKQMMKCWVAIMLLCMGTLPVMAQKNIDRLFEELERRDDVSVNSVTKRDPKTRKIVSVVKSFSLKDVKMAKRMIEVFEKDEEYAETAIKDMPKGRKSAMRVNFNFIFRSDNKRSTYTLTTNEEGTINATCIIKSSKSGGRDISYFLNDDFSEQIQNLVALTDELGCCIIQ